MKPTNQVKVVKLPTQSSFEKFVQLRMSSRASESRLVYVAAWYRQPDHFQKGDTVSVYLPMTWHAVAAFLACARIGAVHSVVFAGFSAESLRDRVQDCKSRVLITSDEGKRGGKTIATKAIVDAAIKQCPLVEHVLVLKRTGNQVPWTQDRDKWWHEEIAKVPTYCPPEIMASEDPLFILYVSHTVHFGCDPIC